VELPRSLVLTSVASGIALPRLAEFPSGNLPTRQSLLNSDSFAYSFWAKGDSSKIKSQTKRGINKGTSFYRCFDGQVYVRLLTYGRNDEKFIFMQFTANCTLCGFAHTWRFTLHLASSEAAAHGLFVA
jgi:hypothetical protein